MIPIDTLLTELQRLVKSLKADLFERLREHPEIDDKVRAEAFTPVEQGGRTAQAYELWREDYLEQVVVAWVLACVFVRFLEDNGLIAETYLAGITPERRRQAEDAHQRFLQAHPHDSDRDYLRDVFARVGSIAAARELFAEGKTPLWALGPSGDGAAALLAFWRAADPATGELLRPMVVEGGDTRFLGDLYQDLSESARKRFALLQTPDFVEEFILDRTLTPALDAFGLESVRLIDPTCGSGHFLLGAFRRLFRLWNEREPGTEPTVLAARALDAVYGVDVNPFAVAIARFRLVVEAMHLCGLRRLDRAPGWKVHVAFGDSLMHGDSFDERGFRDQWLPTDEPWSDPVYGLEDPAGLQAILNRQYHAVVGNPPYITVKDATLNARYRNRWKTCHRQYSLGVPFTERFFNLAMAADDGRPPGFVGMITANSFMKREFGKKLIEEFFPKVDLTHVIDTSGAYIPGHGTPTVILFGRNRRPVGEQVRAVLGIRGEPTTPEDPAEGLVWRSIVDHLDNGQTQNEFVSVTEVDRATFGKHPWSIGGGGAAELRYSIEEHSQCRLGSAVDLIGYICMTRADDLYFTPSEALRRVGIPGDNIIINVEGDKVRDWSVVEAETSLFPYDSDLRPIEETSASPVIKFLWPHRTALWTRREPNGDHKELGMTWYEWSRFQPERYRIPRAIAFAFVATHNHFVLDWGGKVFKQSAPIIKLPADATEDVHLALIGLLNSSTACFWMKQVFHSKGSQGVNEGLKSEFWEQFFEFSGTGVGQFPVLDSRTETLPLARELDSLARSIVALSPAEVVKQEVPTSERLAANRAETERLQARMVALQEELDWLCYRLYGLIREESTTETQRHRDESIQETSSDLCVSVSLWFKESDGGGPGLELGQRPFEIVLARKVAAGEEKTSWFERHGSTPITEIPTDWSDGYREVVARRIELIETDPNINLIERPEYKRRWLREPWEEQVKRALRSWLLDRLESGRYWPDPLKNAPELTSTALLADRAAQDADFLRVAAIYAGRSDFPLAKLLAELVASESVPFLRVLRYKPSGLTKRQVWERTWDLQRREEAGEAVGNIPVPPKYASADFVSADVWRLRGKLDVPKERFISYPHCHRDGDPTLVVGWAGWDHLRQAAALSAYYERMKTREGWPPERLLPLLGGLDQLVPWLLQWHNAVDPEYDLKMGDYHRDFVRDEAQAIGYTLEQVRSWQPPAKMVRGKKK